MTAQFSSLCSFRDMTFFAIFFRKLELFLFFKTLKFPTLLLGPVKVLSRIANLASKNPCSILYSFRDELTKTIPNILPNKIYQPKIYIVITALVNHSHIIQTIQETNHLIILVIEADHQNKEIHEISHKIDIVDQIVKIINIETTIHAQIQSRECSFNTKSHSNSRNRHYSNDRSRNSSNKRNRNYSNNRNRSYSNNRNQRKNNRSRNNSYNRSNYQRTNNNYYNRSRNTSQNRNPSYNTQ